MVPAAVIFMFMVCNIYDTHAAGDVRIQWENGRFLPVPAHKVYRGSFGHSVDINGKYVIVGRPHVSLGLDRFVGSAIIYTFNGTVWDKGVPLMPYEGETLDGYGKAVAISNKYAVVSSPFEENEDRVNSGVVYIYEVYEESEVWELSGKFVSKEGNRGYNFGHSVALSDNIVAVGSPVSDNGESTGSVYVFVNSQGEWRQQAKLEPLKGMRAEYFGSAVAIYKNSLVVFSYWRDYTGEYSSVLFIYVNFGESWVIESIIVPPISHEITRSYPKFPKLMKLGRFAPSIAIHGRQMADTIVVGEPAENKFSGAAFVYKRVGVDWELQTKLQSKYSDGKWRFGTSVSVYRDLIAVSSLGSDKTKSRSACIYVFKNTRGKWRLVRKLFASDGERREGLGAYVAMDNGNVVTGSFNKGDVLHRNGPVYLFTVDELALVT